MQTPLRHAAPESLRGELHQRHVGWKSAVLFPKPFISGAFADKGSALTIRSYNYRNPADPARHDPTCQKWTALQ